MAIDGLIILDNAGHPIIQSGFRSSSPAYPLLHIDALNNAIAKSKRLGDIDPVIYVPTYDGRDALLPSACCHVMYGDIRIICPVSGDVDPLFAFAFLQSFVEILREYFGAVSAATMKDNFDVVYQLLEETLDSGGHPLTTSTNALRDIVLPPSLISKLLANLSAPGAGGTGSAGAGAFASPIPWRKAGLKYNSNDIYFDVVEELKAVVNRSGTPLSSTVWGKIETNAKLSGTPDLLLTFTNPNTLTDCSFHPCVRLQRWTRDKALSFVPPDGRFTLADYRYAPSGSESSGSTLTGSGATTNRGEIVPVPIMMKAVIEIDDFGGTLDLTLTSRLSSRAIQNLYTELYLGEDATGASCMASGGQWGGGVAGAQPRDVSWGYDSKRKVLRWEIQHMPSSSTFHLRGSFTSSAKKPRPARAFRIRFEIHQHSFSALKVEQLKITGEPYKPYKGVRGRSEGDVEWRW